MCVSLDSDSCTALHCNLRKNCMRNTMHRYLKRLGHCQQQRHCRSASANWVEVSLVALVGVEQLEHRIYTHDEHNAPYRDYCHNNCQRIDHQVHARQE